MHKNSQDGNTLGTVYVPQLLSLERLFFEISFSKLWLPIAYEGTHFLFSSCGGFNMLWYKTERKSK